MSMFKKNFKKGDRIKCLWADGERNLTEGRVYTATEDEEPGIFETSPYTQLTGDNGPLTCHSSRFDLVATKEQVVYSEQRRIDGEFTDFCHENGVDPEQADDTDMADWLQGISIPKGR